ncbi:hypothetical protein CCICO_00465 [Corynebacterium ciconiae DSM 44920]|uniref:hypothetical protein n=1 Tax=Corynebacterium ciconiae TaxID=227319 RepID=UPI0003730C3E|nr:hypothetical protein [Corynebacterium ciconiae]WKD60156.1 hypothetical protein CCICO_00465 [Corynebacterium ciconiae DSM 44920]
MNHSHPSFEVDDYDYALLYHVEEPASGAWRRIRVPANIPMDRFARIMRVVLDQQEAGDYCFYTPAATIKPGAKTSTDMDEWAAEAIILGSLDDDSFRFRFDDHLSVNLRLITTLNDTGDSDTLCIDGEGKLDDPEFWVDVINRELDSERWVEATLSRAKSSLKDVINRAGLWEATQLVALGMDTSQRASVDERHQLLEPLVHYIHERHECTPGDPLLRSLGLVHSEGGLTAVGSHALSDPDALWEQLTRTLPVEREVVGNDAAWLLLLSYIAGMPRGTTEAFVMQGMVWAGHRNTGSTILVTDDIRALASRTLSVLSMLGIIANDLLVVGGPLHNARIDLLREIITD